jgi:hypothetical protein
VARLAVEGDAERVEEDRRREMEKEEVKVRIVKKRPCGGEFCEGKWRRNTE